MEHRKKYDLNNLIKIAKENRDTIFNKEISDELNEAMRFCLSFNIKEGGNKVFANLIYQAYQMTAIEPKGKTAFLEEFNTMFEPQKGANRVFYMINYKPAQLLNTASNRRKKVND